MWSFQTDPDFETELGWMRELVDEHLLPLEVLDLDQQRLDRYLAPLQQQVKERGLWAAHLDPELGGRGFGQLKLGLMHEISGRTRFGSMAFGNQPPDSGNSEILARHATPEQRETYLHPLLAGQMRSAYAMTEPSGSADPTNLQTRATRIDGGWSISGTKYFITNASVADFLIVMTATDPDAPAHERATQFLVPAGTSGLNVVREIPSLEDASPVWGRIDNHAEVFLDDVRVPDTAVLGGVGRGFAIAQERLGPGRIHHCMRWIGQASRALDMLCERVTYRSAHGSLLSEKQSIQEFVADSWTEIHAARLMTLHAAWMMDTHGVRAARKEISAIKYWGAGMLQRVVDRALQVHGALGYSGDLPLESMYRHARAARLYDGPDEVHRTVVARQVLRDYAPPPDGVPTEHVPTRRLRAERRLNDLG
jgi:acyl-CoA dehydrogenase